MDNTDIVKNTDTQDSSDASTTDVLPTILEGIQETNKLLKSIVELVQTTELDTGSQQPEESEVEKVSHEEPETSDEEIEKEMGF